jgi:hypothetical protein
MKSGKKRFCWQKKAGYVVRAKSFHLGSEKSARPGAQDNAPGFASGFFQTAKLNGGRRRSRFWVYGRVSSDIRVPGRI